MSAKTYKSLRFWKMADKQADTSGSGGSWIMKRIRKSVCTSVFRKNSWSWTSSAILSYWHQGCGFSKNKKYWSWISSWSRISNWISISWDFRWNECKKILCQCLSLGLCVGLGLCLGLIPCLGLRMWFFLGLGIGIGANDETNKKIYNHRISIYLQTHVSLSILVLVFFSALHFKGLV